MAHALDAAGELSCRASAVPKQRLNGRDRTELTTQPRKTGPN